MRTLEDFFFFIKKDKRPLFVIVIFFIIAIFGCVSQQIDMSSIKISEVVVWDSEFHTVRVINQSEQLQDFTRHWKHFKQIDKLPNTNWTHKFDIKASKLDGRWLYNKQGYLALLNYQLSPAFQVEDPEAFNKLIFGF